MSVGEMLGEASAFSKVFTWEKRQTETEDQLLGCFGCEHGNRLGAGNKYSTIITFGKSVEETCWRRSAVVCWSDRGMQEDLGIRGHFAETGYYWSNIGIVYNPEKQWKGQTLFVRLFSEGEVLVPAEHVHGRIPIASLFPKDDMVTEIIMWVVRGSCRGAYFNPNARVLGETVGSSTYLNLIKAEPSSWFGVQYPEEVTTKPAMEIKEIVSPNRKAGMRDLWQAPLRGAGLVFNAAEFIDYDDDLWNGDDDE